jgi:PST family polysaccharide transporter
LDSFVRLIKNFLSLAVAEGFSKLITFAAFAYLARRLGAETFGYVEFAGAVLMCASLIVDQGFSAFGAKEIAKSPELTARLTTKIVTARLILALAGYLAIVVFALLLDRGPLVMRLLLVYGLSLWALPLLLQWVFQGHERMKLVAIAQIVRQLVFCTVVFSLVRGPEEVLWVAWAEVAGVSATAIFCLIVYRRYFRKEPTVPSSKPIHLFREGVPIGLSQMFWVVKMFGGTLILGLIASAQSVGFFAGAQRILIALHAFVWLYYFNLLPSMARSWQEGNGAFSSLVARSMQAMVWIGVVGGLAWAALSQEAIRFVYGPEFGPAGPVLALFAAVWAMALINGHYRFGLIAAGRANAEMLTAAIGALLALILVPVGYFKGGIVGAAAGLVVAEAGIWISSWWFAQKLLSLKDNSKHLRLPLFALLLVLATHWMLPISAQNARLAVVIVLPAILALILDHTTRIRVRQLFGLLRI